MTNQEPKTRRNDCAFPAEQGRHTEAGLTKREYIATQVLAGIMASEIIKDPYDVLAAPELAVVMADKLINQMNQ